MKATAEKTESSSRKTQQQIAFASGLFQNNPAIRTLLESVAQGVIVVDDHGTIVLVNARAEQMFGYRNHVDEIIGKHHDVLVPKRYHVTHNEHMQGYFKQPRVRPLGVGLDLTGYRRDGSEFPVEISLSFMETDTGLLVLSFVSDITFRKEAERALNQRARELEIAVRELEAFSYTVSHDLRNPLHSIIGLGEILREDFADLLGDKGMHLVHRIVDNGNKMNKLVEDILNLSRASRKEMIVEDVDLAGIAESVISDLRKTYPDRPVDTKVQRTRKIRADAGLMRIAISNLIANSWKFTLKTNEPEIEFGCIEKDGNPTFFVRDNGAGFDMKQAEKLFIPFSRLHTDKEYPGTGIGLATVSRIISRHGGKIWAEGKPGEGATFWFTVERQPKTSR